MKVCFYNVTATVKSGGLETYCHNLARELQKIGVEVEIVGGAGEESVYGKSAVKTRTFPFRPRESFPVLGSRWRKFAERMSFFFHARDYLSQQDYDWMVIVKPYDFPAVWCLKRRGQKTKVFFRSGGRDFYWGDRIFSRAVDVYASSSRFNASQIKERYGMDVEVIPNGVDAEAFHPAEKDDELAKKLGILPRETVITSAGRLVGWKGLQYILSSLPTIQGSIGGIKYLVIGSGKYRKEMETLAASLEIRDAVIFAGEVKHSDLPRYLSLADLFIQPSVGDEAFGITMIEAMSCGLPVIGTKIGGIPEVITDRETGYLIPPGDPQAIARGVLSLLNNVEERTVMGRKARERTLENFTWEGNARRHLEIFRAKGQPFRGKGAA